MTLGDYLKGHAQAVPLIYVIMTTIMVLYTATDPATLAPIHAYFKEHGANITLALVIIMGAIMYFDMAGINLNPDVKHKIDKVVTVEAFEESIAKRIEKGFCKHHKGQTSKLEKDCNTFTKENCLATDCCVWALPLSEQQNKCVAGDNNGPTFRSNDKGKDLDIDKYYFQKKCYGKCE